MLIEKFMYSFYEKFFFSEERKLKYKQAVYGSCGDQTQNELLG